MEPIAEITVNIKEALAKCGSLRQWFMASPLLVLSNDSKQVFALTHIYREAVYIMTYVRWPSLPAEGPKAVILTQETCLPDVYFELPDGCLQCWVLRVACVYRISLFHLNLESKLLAGAVDTVATVVSFGESWSVPLFCPQVTANQNPNTRNRWLVHYLSIRRDWGRHCIWGSRDHWLFVYSKTEVSSVPEED